MSVGGSVGTMVGVEDGTSVHIGAAVGLLVLGTLVGGSEGLLVRGKEGVSVNTGGNDGTNEGITVFNGAKVGLFEAASKGATVKREVGISVIGASVGNAVTEARGVLEGRLDLLGLLVGDEETGE
jgi:hypothetical protein